MSQKHQPKTATASLFRQTEELTQAMKSLEALRLPAIDLKAVTDAMDVVRATDLSALAAAAQPQRLTEALRRAAEVRSPAVEALDAISRQVEALRLPQLTALDDLARQVESLRLADALARPMLPAPGDGPPPPLSPSASPSMQRQIGSPADLGTLVRERRRAMGLTQQDLADTSGTGRRFVSELESGKATLEFGKVLGICRNLGLDFFAGPR